MIEQREVAWTENGWRRTGKLLGFVAFPNMAEVDTLHAIVEMEHGYVRTITVSAYVLHFTHTVDGVKYE